MRRILAIILLLSALLALGSHNTVYAEEDYDLEEYILTHQMDDFSLRNDIRFGDSLEVVCAKEEVEMRELKEADDNSNGLYYWGYRKTVSGYYNTYIYFLFDKNKDKFEEIHF